MQNPLLIKIEALQINLSIESNRLTKNLVRQWETYQYALTSKSQLWLNQLVEKRQLKTSIQTTNTQQMMQNDKSKMFQQLESKLSYFQHEVQKLKANTLQEITQQRSRLQALLEELISFLDDLIAPLTDKNPFFIEDFMLFLDNLKLELNGLQLDLQTSPWAAALQTFIQSERLNEQLIEVRHRIEKQKDSLLEVPTQAYKQVVSAFELVEQDFKRLFM